MMIIVTIISIAMSLLVARLLPTLIKKTELEFIRSCGEININKNYTKTPFLSFSFICPSTLFCYYLSHDLLFSSLVLTLGIAAYVDFKRQWVPDSLIFILFFISFMIIKTEKTADIFPALTGAIVFLSPYLIFNLISLTNNKPCIFSSGDLAIVVSLAFIFDPLISSIINALAIIGSYFTVIFYKRNEIPFVPFLHSSVVVVFCLREFIITN